MAPLRSQIFDMLKREHSACKMSYWYGARSLREMFYTEEFDELAAAHDNFEWHVALSDPLPEDNFDGHTGFIHQVVYDQYLKDHPNPEDCEYYLCGPPPRSCRCLKIWVSSPKISFSMTSAADRGLRTSVEQAQILSPGFGC